MSVEVSVQGALERLRDLENVARHLGGPIGLSAQKDVDLLLDPLLVVRRVGVGGLLIHQAGQVRQLK